MVDDTMEISSDHGHNDEQEDIDIDLDLTADPGDEDFVLEDATSHVDFGNDFHPQSSAAVNDDIMLDDDNESYEMEDAGLLEEETEHIIEQESMSFATDGDASYYGVSDRVGEQSLADDTKGLSYDGYDAANDESLGFDLQQEPEVVLPEDLQDLDEPHSKNTEDVAQGTAVQGSQTSSPSRHSLPPTSPTEPRSPPTSVEPGRSPAHSTHDHIDPISPHGADNSTVDISSIKDASCLQHVVVVYRDVDYALFSTSEHDNPDLYFLSDMAIAEKPLSEFFRAIREVIRDDLGDEDELCIVVDSLGLQAEEVSSFIDDVTLLQVLSLHSRLTQNDGLETSEGCHIVLKTRTNFSRRFSKLIAGAAEGKGLSQFAYWDDQSVGLDDSEDLEESKYDFESKAEGQELGEATENYHGQQECESAEINGPGQDLVAQEDGQNDLQKSETEAENEVENAKHAAVPEETSSGGDPVVVTPKSTAPKSPKKTQERESDVDEDGDLIDYSDDEDVMIEEKRKAAARNTDNDGTATEEFEQRDALLRRRSLDRRQSSAAATPEEHKEGAEGTTLEHQQEEHEEGGEETALEHQQLNDAGETILHAEEGSVEHDEYGHPFEKEEYTDQNEIGYEQFQAQESEDVGENDYEHFNENILEYGHEQTDHDALASISVAQVDTDNDENNDILEQYGEGGDYGDADLDHDYAAEQGANYESAIANFENDDLEFEVEDLSFQEELKQDGDLLELNETNGHISPQDASKAGSLDVVETAESSVTMGADEIQYEDDLLEETIVAESDKSAPLEVKASPEAAEAVEQKDEIDYEDDDEEAELSLQSPTLIPEVQGYQNANGKRSIADVESNDSQTPHAKDAKRPRS